MQFVPVSGYRTEIFGSVMETEGLNSISGSSVIVIWVTFYLFLFYIPENEDFLSNSIACLVFGMV